MKADRLKLVISGVYFVQGAVIVSAMAEFLLTRNLFKFTWLEIATLGALTTLAWCVKPIYGFLTDLVPILGLRRKYYLFLAALMAALGYGFLFFGGINFPTIALGLVTANIGFGLADVIVDGLIVERSSPDTVGRFQSIAWGARSLGTFCGAFFSGFLIERKMFSGLMQKSSLAQFLADHFPRAFPLGTDFANLLDLRFTLLVTGALALLSFLLVFLLDDRPYDPKLLAQGRSEISKPHIFSALLAFGSTLFILIAFSGHEVLTSLAIITIWSVWILSYAFHLIRIKAASSVLVFAAIFLFLWRFTPSFGAPWSDYYLNTLQLSREKIGFLSSLGPIAWIIGSIIYAKFLDRLPLKKILFWTVVLGSGLSLSQLVIATPELATQIGETKIVRGLAYLLLTPIYFIVYGNRAFAEILSQPAIINLDTVLSFCMQVLFMISFLPLLKLSALVTPKGVEATNFAVLMSIMNLGLAFGSISGGAIYSWIEGSYAIAGLTITSLHLSVFIGALASLLCLVVLPKLNLSTKKEN